MNSLLRAAAFAITIGMMKLLPALTFLQLVTSFGIAHYLQVSFVARKKYTEVFYHSFRRSVNLGILMMAILIFSIAIGFFLPEIAMRWLFGVHFVFSEVFLFKTMTTDSGKELYHSTRIHRLVLNTYFYACYCYIEMIQSPLMYAAVLIAGLTLMVLYVSELHKVTGGKWSRESIDLLVYEVLGFLIVPLAAHTRAGYAAVIVYHFVIWWMIPIKLKAPGAIKYLFSQAVMSAVIFSLIPLIGSWPYPLSIHWTWLIVFGYFHIITTFFISSWNPKFILSWNERFLWRQNKT